MDSASLRGLCFLFLKDRVPVSSPLTLKSYDSDFRGLFYKKHKLLFPLLGADASPPLKNSPAKNAPPPEKPHPKNLSPKPPPQGAPLPETKDLFVFQKDIRLQERLERHIKERLQSASFLRLSPASCCRKLSAVKAFTAWLFKNGYIQRDFRRLFKSPRLSQKTPDFLSADEALALFKSLEQSRDKKKGRDAALFCLLYGGGLRVSEACHIRNRDFREEGILLEIPSGKGGKPRLVSLPRKSFQAVQRFQEERRAANGGMTEEWLFGPKPLSVRLAYNIIRRRGAAAGLLKPLHPHALRHSFATHLLSSGADLRSLQELLGHKTLTAVQKYTHLDMRRLSQTLEECHPLNRSSPDIFA